MFNSIKSSRIIKGDELHAFRDPTAILVDGVYHLFYTLLKQKPMVKCICISPNRALKIL